MTDRLSRPNQPIATKWNLNPDVDFLQCTFVTVYNALRILSDEIFQPTSVVSIRVHLEREIIPQPALSSSKVFRRGL